MAEGWTRVLLGDRFEAHSAGVEPRGLDLRAVKVMAEAGVDISRHASKRIDRNALDQFDCIVTFSERARAAISSFGYRGRTLHAEFPASPPLPERDLLAHYRRVRDGIRELVRSLRYRDGDGAEVEITCRIESDSEHIDARVEKLWLEQGAELPQAALRSFRVPEEIQGCVREIREADEGAFSVRLAYDWSVVAGDPAQLLNLALGNSSMMDDVTLMDIELPRAAFADFTGPRHGVGGLRAACGVYDRPLTCTALKPKGWSAHELAGLCRGFARAGIDVVKDDHGLADHPFCRFEDRVRLCQRAVDEVAVETGRRTLYVPNLTGTPGQVARQYAVAHAHGARAVMIAPMLLGIPLLLELTRRDEALPVIAHPSLAGAWRIAPDLLLGKLFRWFGADAVIFTAAGGRFKYSEDVCRRIAQALADPTPGIRPSFPVPAGGLRLDQLTGLVGAYGKDSILLMAGDLYQAGEDVFARARQFAQSAASFGRTSPAHALHV